MSNEVNLSTFKAHKIQKNCGGASKTNEMVHSRHHIERRNIKSGLDSHPVVRHQDDIDCVSGTISPGRIGGASYVIHQQGDVDTLNYVQHDTNGSDNNISSCSMLDIINKVENMSVHQLQTQVIELSKRLKQSEVLRERVQQQLEEVQNEKESCIRRLQINSAAHESRNIEMHCIVAELTKKLKAKRENMILEEQEQEGSDLSFQDKSVCKSEMNMTNPDSENQTGALFGGDLTHCDISGNVRDPWVENSIGDKKRRIEAIQEEVLRLKAQIALLQSEIANPGQPISKDDIIKERESFEYYESFRDENDSSCSLEPPIFVTDGKVLNFLDGIIKSEVKKIDSMESLLSDGENENSTTQQFMKNTSPGYKIRTILGFVKPLKIENQILSLSLDECKQHCERLYLLCGKYESNAIALQTAVNCTDRAIEAYDVMLALLESKLAIMNENSIGAEENRKAVESVARHLLDCLESEKGTYENSLGPWQKTFSIPDKTSKPWTTEDDTRLRYHVSKLKGLRSTVQNTILNLESPFSDVYEKSRFAIESGMNVPKLDRDLETVVNLEELEDLREDNGALRDMNYWLIKSTSDAIKKMQSVQEAVKPLQMQLNNDSNVLFQDTDSKNRVSYSEAEHIALTEQQLIEALARESELKGRVQTLLAAVSASQNVTDEKYVKLKNNIKELLESNISLSNMMERNKRKYQTRIKGLEQRLLELNLHDDDHTGESRNGVPETTL